ncbi:FTR1 family protein [Vogesella fluminis]|uniref:Membrane protein n=1 Tax=Vogesella fluminis TaxID=1069161 RepID=A0ABQ3HBY3_9NEIS|nr:FTR1 family protein [Vogesella fluminis]GHD77471.1 membrane protein [Vogesella fluminis]
MEQVLFIVWRESVEAMLVIGILHAWLSQNPVTGGKRWLWGGVLAGLLLAALLALGLFAASELFGSYQDMFQAAMVFTAAALIVHMVLWMREHGRNLKCELEAGLAASSARHNGWGILLLVALAVGREGSETVVFLYGTLSGSETLWPLLLAGTAGFLLALLSFWLLQLGGRYLSWRLFFRVTEVMLLLLAAALFTSGIDKLISLDILPALVDPLWDSSALLDDMSASGGVVSALTGYRAHPALMTLLAYAGYWLAVLALMRWRGRRVVTRLAA